MNRDGAAHKETYNEEGAGEAGSVWHANYRYKQERRVLFSSSSL